MKDEVQQLTIKLKQYEFLTGGLTGAVDQGGTTQTQNGINQLDAANQSTASIINNVGDLDDQVDSQSQQTQNMSEESQTILNRTSLSQGEQAGLKIQTFSAGGGSQQSQ